MEELSWEWKTVPLGDTAKYAGQLAATELGPHEALSPGRLLLALSRMDLHGNWSRIWVRTGYPSPDTLGAARDVNHAELAATWHGGRASGDLARSLSPDDLDLLAVLVASGAVGRAGNEELLARTHHELADEARPFGTRPAAAVVESAREEFGVMVPNAQQVMFAAVG